MALVKRLIKKYADDERRWARRLMQYSDDKHPNVKEAQRLSDATKNDLDAALDAILSGQQGGAVPAGDLWAEYQDLRAAFGNAEDYLGREIQKCHSLEAIQAIDTAQVRQSELALDQFVRVLIIERDRIQAEVGHLHASLIGAREAKAMAIEMVHAVETERDDAVHYYSKWMLVSTAPKAGPIWAGWDGSNFVRPKVGEEEAETIADWVSAYPNSAPTHWMPRQARPHPPLARLAEQPAPAGGLRPGLEKALEIIKAETETMSSLSPGYARLQAIVAKIAAAGSND
jgi:hypothetical protein